GIREGHQLLRLVDHVSIGHLRALRVVPRLVDLQVPDLRMYGCFAQLNQRVLDESAAQNKPHYTRHYGAQGERSAQPVSEYVAQSKFKHACVPSFSTATIFEESRAASG